MVGLYTKRKIPLDDIFLSNTTNLEYDEEKDYLSWSEMTKKIHEVPDDYSPTREDAFTFYQEEDAEKLRISTDRALEKGTPFDLELRFVTAKSNKKQRSKLCILVYIVNSITSCMKIGGNFITDFEEEC